MRFIFRADASREVGSGHVMRSSVLAEEAISRGYECIFLGTILELGWVAERISQLGFSQVLSDYSSFVPNAETDVLILDSYSIPVSNSFIAKGNWRLVLYICDEITPRYDADIELRPGLEKVITVQNGPVVLSGKEYILIRKEIEKTIQRREFDGITKVLIVGGGSDPFGYVPAVTKVILALGLKLEVHIFTNDLVKADNGIVLVNHRIGPELDSIAQEVDVVFTTASTSSLEFIAREIPTGVVCAVDNQADYYEQFGRLGYASPVGIRNSEGVWEFDAQGISELLVNPKKREELKRSITGLIDLTGAQRVIDFLISFGAKHSQEGLTP